MGHRRWLINLARRLVVRSLKYPFDQTVATYIGTAVSVILNIALIIAILGLFGIETTSFASVARSEVKHNCCARKISVRVGTGAPRSGSHSS